MTSTTDNLRLSGKVAIVTGAAGGIGRAASLRFAAEGAAVICVDRDDAALQDAVEQIRAHGHPSVDALLHDVTDAEGLVAAASDRHGRVDVFLANAAVQVMGDLEHTVPDDWDYMYAVNLRAVADAIRHLAPLMRATGGGSIILTASLLGMTGDADLPMYGASKGALRALCRSVATALGPDQIRCNTICPGDVDTRMVQDFFEYQPDPAVARRSVESHYPLGRIASPVDVANAALFLASDDSSYITGTDLVVDGGLLARIY